MGESSTYTAADIERRTAEFNAANKRDHARFAIGAIVLAVLFLGVLLIALA